MNSKNLLFAIMIVSICSCKAQTNSKKAATRCFSNTSFTTVKDYILKQISISSSGYKYYLEYPIDKDKVNDGIMRPSKHPENVFDIFYDKQTGQIVFENQLHSFHFDQTKGFILNKNQTEKDTQLANDIFCFLFESYEKTREK